MQIRTVAELMALPEPEPIIQNLLYTGNIVLLHGAEESFKSIFIAQFAENLATGTSFLRTFHIPQPFRVGLIETEIDEAFTGSRFRKMFPHPISNLFIASDNALKDFRRAKLIKKKLQWVKEFVDQAQLDIIMIDVVNDFFRGEDNASKEQDVGELFDGIRSMGLKAAILVRHDKKFQYNQAGFTPPSSNEHIRGSGEWKEDPETILWLHRLDKRTNQAEVEVGKMRYGKKPDTLKVWFDAGNLRLTPLTPILAMLETGPLTREQLVEQGKARFDLGHALVDKMVKKDQESKIVYERQRGHQKEFAIDWVLAKELNPYLSHPTPQQLAA